MKENVKVNQGDSETLSLVLSNGDFNKLHMTGDSIDRIYKNGKLVETVVGHNLVVDSFLRLIMCTMCQQSGGMQYWAVGSGEESWDSVLPTPDPKATTLTSEIGRSKILSSDFAYLDQDLNVVSTPTNILQVSHVFDTNECNGVWREFGIFGGNATEETDSGIMVNKRHHAIITKTSEMIIERVMRFTLNLL